MINSNRIKRLVVVALPLLILLGIIYWLSTHAFIKISIENATGETVTNFSLRTDKGSSEGTIKGQVTRKLVRKGSYRLTLTGDHESHVAITEAGGFLKTTTVNARLEKERDRAFVGNGPKPCMDASSLPTISWPCYGDLEDGVIHTPATNTIPTLQRSLKSLSNRSIEFVLSSGDQRLALVRSFGDIEIGRDFHAIYNIDLQTGTLSIPTEKALNQLSSERRYSLEPYKEGYLIYGRDGNELFYYPSTSDQPTTIKPATTEVNQLKFYSLDTFGESIVMAFNQHFTAEHQGSTYVSASNVVTKEFGESVDEGVVDEDFKLMNQSEVVILKNGEQTRYKFNYNLQQVRLCAVDLLCVLHEEKLSFYKLNGSEAEFLYDLPGVLQIGNTDESLFVVDEFGVLRFDPVKRTGAYVYSFGEYLFCGLDVYSTHQTICVRKGESRSLLNISEGEMTDTIDQQVAKLSSTPSVKTVSAYDKFIHISPELSSVPFSSGGNGAGYDATKLKEVNDKINQSVVDIGINREKYQIINALAR